MERGYSYRFYLTVGPLLTEKEQVYLANLTECKREKKLYSNPYSKYFSKSIYDENLNKICSFSEIEQYLYDEYLDLFYPLSL